MMNTNMRRLLKTPTLRMMDGGDLQVPKGPGMDRAGMLARNPGVAQNQTASPSPGQLSTQPAAPAPMSLSTMPAPTPVGVSPMPGSVNPNAGKYGSAPIGAPVDQGAAMDRKMLADSAATRAAAPPVPAQTNFGAPTTQPTRPAPNFDRQAAILTANQDVNLGLAAAGLDVRFKNGGDLRTGHGGLVPGSGKGDKIDAKYEPGEFVVSNDMLEKAPGLRDMLHGLRSEALADKGMTPEQADAKAVSGPTLRAQSGGLYPYNQPEVDIYKNLGMGNKPPAAKVPGKGLYPYNRPERDIYAGLGKPASAPENQPGPGGILSPRQTQGEQNGQTQTTVAGAGPASAGGATGGWRNSAPAPGVPGSQGRPSGAVSRPEDEFMPGTKAVFNEGGKDIAAALGQGKYTKAAFTGLRQLAAYPVALADDVVGGAVRGAYGMLRNPVEDAGRAMLGMEDRKEAPPAPTAGAVTRPGTDANMPGQEPRPAAPVQKLVTEGGRQYLPETVSNADRLQSDALVKQAFSRDTKNGGKFSMNDGINTLRTDPNAMATANKAWAQRGAGIQASYDSKGGLVLSNSTGPEKMQYTDREGNPTSKYENTSQFDQGQQQLAQARASLRNPDGSTWSAQDNALMAANLRDGVSPYAGTSRADKTPQMSPLRARLEAMGGRGMSKNQATTLLSLREADQRNEVAMAQNQTTLRGQDLEAEERRATAAGASASAARAQANDDRKYELDVVRLGVEQANKLRDDKRAGDEAFGKRIAGMVGDDKDGTKAAAIVNSANMFLGDAIRAAETELRNNPGNAKAARDLKRLQGGVGSLDDKKISELMLSTQASGAVKEYAGVMPWSGEAQNSAAPIKSLTLKKGLLFDDYVSDTGSGNQVLPARALKNNPDLNRLVVQ